MTPPKASEGAPEHVPTPDEARAILRRFNASHFNLRGQEHARFRIPADPKHDDDLRLSAFIKWAESQSADLTRLRTSHGKLVARISDLLDYLEVELQVAREDKQPENDLEDLIAEIEETKRCLAQATAASGEGKQP
jgi:hypothetical protein